MSRTESPLFQGSVIKDQSAISVLDPVVEIARKVLPEEVKAKLRQVMRHEVATIPLPEPVNLRINGTEANFWVLTHSDWYRIKSQDFEGPYAQEMVETISQRQNPIFADIGAAQGVYTILAAKAGAEVFAFDPDPVSLDSFARNLSLNPNLNIQYFNFALGDKDGSIELNIDRKGIYAPSLEKTVAGLSEKVVVPIYPFDQLISEGAVPAPEIVKIDVEGAEGIVLNGMRKTLTSEIRPTDLFIEIHTKYLPKFGTSAGEIVSLIKDFGYKDVGVWERRKDFLCHFTATQ